MSMHTREISKDSWERFLEDFSRTHELWRVSLNIVDPEMEAHAEYHEMPLIRIEFSTDGILVTLRDDAGGKTTHVVRKPAHLWLEETEEGAHKSLQIESAEGVRTLIGFRSAVLPETLDGIVSGQE